VLLVLSNGHRLQQRLLHRLLHCLQHRERNSTVALSVGDMAPDFELKNQFGELVKLSSFIGKKAVTLVFFPLAFTGVCTGELCELRDNFSIFADDNVELMAISVDNKATLRAFAEDQGYEFALLSDFWPHGAVAQQYGVFLEGPGHSNRATFVIDIDGILRASFVTAPGEARPLADYREALAVVAAA
jgi:peroxiredoxin